MYVDEGIAEALDAADLEHDVALLAIPAACKDALQSAIKQLNTHSSRLRIMSGSFGSESELESMNKDNVTSGKSKDGKRLLSSSFSPSHPLCTMGLVVIEGEIGSGKEEAMIWVKRSCANRALVVVSMHMFVEDRAADYSTVARLFRLLIREENFDDPVRQKLVVENLLRETYPHDQTTREKIAYPSVCHALKVTWPDRFRRFSPMPAIQEEEKGASRPDSQSGSTKPRGSSFVGWVKKRSVLHNNNKHTLHQCAPH